ncbi:MAG: IclR family transcriptional regulator [Granulicella sp.]
MLKTKAVAKAKIDKSALPPARDKYFSRAVSKALETLEFLRSESSFLQMNEIAERLRLSKTSTFRMLRTLETLGYVSCDGRGRYMLSPGIHSVTPAQWVGRLVSVATPHLHALTLEFSETASLAALFDNRVEVVAVIESPHVIRMSNVLGSILPPNASSLGKVIAAFQPELQREKLLRCFKIYRFTEHTIIDQRDLNLEYDHVRAQGFAIDREECTLDGVCFSVPVFDGAGHVSAAMSMSIPKTRVRDVEHETLVIEALRAATTSLSVELSRP